MFTRLIFPPKMMEPSHAWKRCHPPSPSSSCFKEGRGRRFVEEGKMKGVIGLWMARKRKNGWWTIGLWKWKRKEERVMYIGFRCGVWEKERDEKIAVKIVSK